MAEPPVLDEFDDLPSMPLSTLAVTLLAAVGGAFGAVVVLPQILPGLSSSLLGPEPKAYWYLARSSAFIAYIMLWASMIFGLIITNRMARVWPGGPTAFDLHQHVSLLGLAVALFHGLILVGDRYIGYTVAQVLIPFAGADYRPAWVGIGQLGFYLLALVSLTFYVRKTIGHQAWRLIHFLSFVVFAMAIVHGVMSGTDGGAWWAAAVYWVTGATTLFLTIYRVLASAFKQARHRDVLAATPAESQLALRTRSRQN
jgi:predicted ferric reductase